MRFEMTINLTHFLNQPLTIGTRQIQTRLSLAPMARLGNVAFRELVSSFGGYGLLFTEMCSSKTVAQGNGPKWTGFRWRKAELSELVCQLFGNDPGMMAAAARRVEHEGFFGVDINFGCSVHALCKQNCGAALLKQPALAAEIVSSVRRSVACPVFVKFRTGWQDDPQIAVDLARRFEDAGADALSFHPRVAPDRRTRLPKWEYIGNVKASVDIPVFGNGNVFDAGDCSKMIETTGCDAVMVGRLAVAKPWIFSSLSGDYQPEPETCADCALKLLKQLPEYYDVTTALRRFKEFMSYFAANFRFGHSLYLQIRRQDTLNAVEETIVRFFSTQPEMMASKPNISLFR